MNVGLGITVWCLKVAVVVLLLLSFSSAKAIQEEKSSSSEDDYEYLEVSFAIMPLENDCRDDISVDCDGVEACEENDLLSIRHLCPVTCKICEVPVTAIWVDYDCFEHREEIQVYFSNQTPEPGDLVGIYTDNYDEPVMWLHTCGNQFNKCRVARGGLWFGHTVDGENTWDNFPLQVGRYKAVLIREHVDESGTVLAESDAFDARDRGHSCSGDCKYNIYTDQTCYTPEDIVISVTFENCAPHPTDQIAVYYNSEAMPGHDEPLLWLGACGSQECKDVVDIGTIQFGFHQHVHRESAEWNLPPGDYKVHILRLNQGDTGPSRSLAESAPFSINFEGESCNSEDEEL